VQDAVPRFSVVVPAHNEAEVLGRTLGSLRAQDFAGPVEVVVVDNGSTDGTGDLARAAGVRVEEEPSLGVCAARQRGTELAHGQIVVSTDADTVHPPDWLSRIDTAFRDDPDLVAVAGPCRYEDPPGWAAVLAPLGFAAVRAVHALTGRVGYVTATNIAFRREGFQGYDTSLTQGGDEVDLLRRLRRQGRVTWDGANAVCTSSRRLDQGLAHTVLVSFGYYYAGGHVVNRLARRRVVGVAPPVRPTDARRVRQVRRRWQLVAIGIAVSAAAVRHRRVSGAG
jgi:glycosyltransferase involved in cell wall biosynthesis